MKFFHVLVIGLFSLNLSAQSAHNMHLCSNWDPGYTFNDIWGFVNTSGQEYAVIGSSEKISVVDLTNPYNPTLAGEVAPGMSTDWRDIKTYGNYIYAVSEADGEGLVVINTLGLLLGNLSITFQSNTDFDLAHNIFIDELNGRLYVVGGRKGNTLKDIIVYDLTTNPGQPTHLATTALTGGYVHDVYVRDHIAYCSHGNFGFGIYDMTNPGTPVELATQSTNGYNHSSWLSTNGDYAFICEEIPSSLPILTIDLTDIANNNIPIVASFKAPLLAPTHTNNRPHNPFVKGNYLFVSYYQDGVVVFDISDPLNPFRVAFYDTSNNTSYAGFENVWGVYPYLPSGKIIASDQNQGLFVMELLFDIPLSVDLDAFEAVVNTDAVDVKWQTYNATNDASYDVEKSRDGIHFEFVEKIAAEALVDVTSNYLVTDKYPFTGTNYYRLKIIDKARHIDYTDPIEVTFQLSEIEIFPTLIKHQNELTVRFLNKINENYSVNLLNLTGDMVYSNNQINSNEDLIISTDHLPNGLYLANIYSLKTHHRITKKILINR